MSTIFLVLASFGFLLLAMSAKLNILQKDKATEPQAGEMQSSEELPTYQEIAKSPEKSSEKDLLYKTKNAQKPEDLLVHLLSTELNIDDKKTLIRNAPSRIYDSDHHRQNAEKVEAQLKDAGYSQLAIVLYWCFFWHGVQPRGPESWIKELIENDIERRWIAQRRARIQEKVQTLETSSDLLLSSEGEAEHASQLELYKGLLQDLNRSHWALSRKSWNKRESIKSWSFSRAYNIQRSYPDWYLSTSLSDDCAGRGGCCGRSCGCCERPRTVDGFEDHIGTRGHCTTACSCCMKAHGVEDLDDLLVEEIPDLEELCFEYKKPSCMTHQSLRLLMGYAFNLPKAE